MEQRHTRQLATGSCMRPANFMKATTEHPNQAARIAYTLLYSLADSTNLTRSPSPPSGDPSLSPSRIPGRPPARPRYHKLSFSLGYPHCPYRRAILVRFCHIFMPEADRVLGESEEARVQHRRNVLGPGERCVIWWSGSGSARGVGFVRGPTNRWRRRFLATLPSS